MNDTTTIAAFARPSRSCAGLGAANAGALFVALTLASAGDAQAEDPATYAITTVFEGLVSGATGSAGSDAFSWAMSAIGLAGGDPSELGNISKELGDIDDDLKNMNSTLEQIQDVITQQTCIETQIAEKLENAVFGINYYYGLYQGFLANAADPSKVPPSQSDVEQWQGNVLTDVPTYLSDIH